MYFSYVYRCDSCGDERDFVGNADDGGKCSCGGNYQRAGETYDQEYVDQKRYEEQQDREYEERHRHDR